jgi:hypothetical protein
MLKQISKALFVSRAWLVSIAFLLAVAAIVGTSQAFQACIDDHYQHSTAQNFEQSIAAFAALFGVYRDCLGDFTHDNAEAIIAAFTIILAFSTIFLWVATRDLVRSADDTAKRQLRAYVFVSGSAVTNVVEGNGIPEAQVVIQNFGRTPAYAFVNVTGFGMNAYPHPQSIRLTIPEKEFSGPIAKSDLGPTQSQMSTTDWKEKKRPLRQEEKTALAQGKLIIYVYGEIRYIDTFDRPQWTKYRYMMGGPVGIRSGGQLVPCAEGNEAS